MRLDCATTTNFQALHWNVLYHIQSTPTRKLSFQKLKEAEYIQLTRKGRFHHQRPKKIALTLASLSIISDNDGN